MKRTPITKLIGKRISAIRLSEDRRNYEFLSSTQKMPVLFTVPVAYLFDGDGMYFDTEEIE